ncbi:MAG: hypothetical protein P8N43_09440 [Alphaproteobacteria bacterium]|nr:hypothetical protein [Alphaproteobacteria bacterium]
MTNSDTGIEVKVGFFPLAFFLFFCKPRIEINGQVHLKSWGTHYFPVEPGEHTVKIYFGYPGMEQCGANSISVAVNEDETVKVNFYMPPWILSKGSINVV